MTSRYQAPTGGKPTGQKSGGSNGNAPNKRSFGERPAAGNSTRYVDRNGDNRDNRDNRRQNVPRENAQISSRETLEQAWENELVKNANASLSEFIDSKRVQGYFNVDHSAHEFFLKRAEKVRSEFSHRRLDSEKTARQFRSQKLYAWADQWDKYAKYPNSAYPECTHHQLKEGQFKCTDAKGNFLEYNEEAYRQFLDRVPPGRKEGGGTGGRGWVESRDEISNAELGKQLSGNCNNLRKGKTCTCEGKGHPDKLIAKLNQLREKYPEHYRKDNSIYA